MSNKTTMDPIESALQSSSRKRAVPADLHDSIMQRVREAAAGASPQSNLARSMWRSSTALSAALLVVAALCFTLIRIGERASSGKSASIAIEPGGEIPEQAAEVLIGPLARELDHANRDVKNAIQFLLASVP
ncbi:MAG: hypothetical protein GX456_08250 [Verrucomicrobia bacterium]|nr:hypothetical protein [Verrucomicrobiota bacterium]